MRAKLRLGLAALASQGFAALMSLPSPVLERIGRAVPEQGDGLAPDQKAIAVLDRMINDEDADLTLEQARLGFEASCRMASWGSFRRKLAVSEETVSGAEGPLRARLYDPRRSDQAPRPLLVWLHGGGWVVGSVDSHDRAMRRIAVGSRLPLLSVEYRLAPENPWPAAPDDVLAAWRDISARAAEFGSSSDRIMIGGDSAGGNLAAVLCQDLRRLGEPQPLLQVLTYPACDLAGRSVSYERFSEGFVLTGPAMEAYKDAYVPDHALRTEPRVSPLFQSDLSGLAPAWVGTAIADPLRDEGEAYGYRLAEAGVEVRIDRFPAIHGCLNITGSPTGRAIDSHIAALLSAVGVGGTLDDVVPGPGTRVL